MLINTRQTSSTELLSWIKLTFDSFNHRPCWCICPSRHLLISLLYQHHQLSAKECHLAA